MIRTALLLVSDHAATSGAGDASVQAVRELLAEGPFTEVDFQSVPAEQAIIRAKLRLWTDGDDTDLVLTIGGTGLAMRDRTPEATREVIEREVEGLPELMRLVAMQQSRRGALERLVAGIRRRSLIVTLPAEPDAARTALDAVRSVLPVAVETIAQSPRVGETG